MSDDEILEPLEIIQNITVRPFSKNAFSVKIASLKELKGSILK